MTPMEFEKYCSYTVEDFLEDTIFRRWALGETPEMNEQWDTFFDLYPRQKEIATRACVILQEMKDYFQPESSENKPLDEAFIFMLKNEVRSKSRRRLFLQRLSIAASLLLLVGFFSWYLLNFQGDAMQVYVTQYGERKTFELPDGSIVSLNANSELKTPGKWKKGVDRVVWLKGEGHFMVSSQPDTRAKFSVITKDLSVNVLGTIFNVRARNLGTQVTLEEGKISLNLKEQTQEQEQKALPKPIPIVMTPGDQVQYSAQTRHFQKSENTDVIAKSSWKDGVLIFNSRPLEELGNIITETFGYSVVFKDSTIRNLTITSTLPAENDLDLLLETLEKAFDEFTIVKKDNYLIFE